MPQLDPTWFVSQLFWLLVTFMALYAVLAHVVLPSLQNVMARRQNTIEENIALAEKFRIEAETARQDYERSLAEARDRAQQLVTEAMEAQKAKAERANKELDAHIATKLADASARITARKKELIEALAPATEELTSLIVEKLTHRNPTKDKIGSVVTQLFKTNNSR